MIKASIIRQVPLFASLPESELVRLEQSLVGQDRPAGALLIEEGASGSGCYVLLAGEVEIIKSLGSDDERLLGVRAAGTTLGEMSLFSEDHLPTASVRAHTDVNVLELHRSQLEQLMREYPSLSFEMFRTMSQRLEESENLTIKDLREKNRQLQLAYDELKAAQAQLVEKERLERELEVAREIQMSMLPAELPQIETFDFGARIFPASAVGGDFYDVIDLGAGSLGITVGDVTGHGVPAALLMALTATLIRAEAPRSPTPAAVLQAVNRALIEANRTGHFVTALYGVLSSSSREFQFARAGHSLPMVVGADGTLQELPLGVGQPLGLFEDMLLDEGRTDLSPGSTMLIYTDGVTEAVDDTGEFFEEERLLQTVQSHRGTGSDGLCEAIWHAVQEYQGAVPREDDVTVLAVTAAHNPIDAAAA